MTKTDSAKLCTRNDIFSGLAPIGVAFAAAPPGSVRAATRRGAMS